jgi:hypothetical protein
MHRNFFQLMAIAATHTLDSLTGLIISLEAILKGCFSNYRAPCLSEFAWI